MQAGNNADKNGKLKRSSKTKSTNQEEPRGAQQDYIISEPEFPTLSRTFLLSGLH